MESESLRVYEERQLKHIALASADYESRVKDARTRLKCLNQRLKKIVAKKVEVEIEAKVDKKTYYLTWERGSLIGREPRYHCGVAWQRTDRAVLIYESLIPELLNKILEELSFKPDGGKDLPKLPIEPGVEA